MTTPTATPVLTHFNAHSTPSTPIASKTMMNDSSFLNLNTVTPTMNNFLPSRIAEQHLYQSSGGFSHNMTEVLDHVTPLSPPPRSRRRSQQIITSFEPQPEDEQPSNMPPPPPAPLSPESPSPVSLTPAHSMFGDHDDSDHDTGDEDDYTQEEESPSADSEDLETVGDALDQVLARRGNAATTKVNPVDPSNAFSMPPHGSVVSLGHVTI
ncbi:hypothetical protein NMY22_g18354 [Coprinellus aureogranulatus]|nr:hypothetical protein NMY22_g18354 [Coprinellus aureogranulatus]